MSQACVLFFLCQTKAVFPGVHVSYPFLRVDFAKYSGSSHYSHCCKQPTLVTTTNMKPSFCFQVITFIVDDLGGLSKDILDSDKLQYRSKISEPFNAFATRCKLRANALVEKSNAFAN